MAIQEQNNKQPRVLESGGERALRQSGPAEAVRCHLAAALLEIRDDAIAYYNISQDNYCLLEVEEVAGDCEIRIRMEWGPEPYHLTTRNRAREILCQTGYGWRAEYIERGEEDYWRLTKEEAVDQYDAKMYLKFSNIIVYNEGVARLRLCYVREGIEGPSSYVQLQKTFSPLRIERFEPEVGTVRPACWEGEKNAVLTWCVLGADRCVLNPGNFEVPLVGSMEVSAAKNSVYTLSAFSRERSVEKSTVVYTYKEVYHDLFQVDPPKYYEGCGTRLYWNLRGEVSDLCVWRGDKKIWKLSGRSEGEGEMTDTESRQVYTLSFLRGGKPVELCCEREPDERQAVLLFRAHYSESLDAFHLRWDTFKAKKVELRVYYRRRDPSTEASLEYVNQYKSVSLSRRWSGDERWQLEHDKKFPVYFILRLENVYGERVEKHIEHRA